MIHTLCPGCLTVSRVRAAELNAEGGLLHCARCGLAYPAAGQLFDAALDAQAARLVRERQAREADAAEAARVEVRPPGEPEVVAEPVPALLPESEPAREAQVQSAPEWPMSPFAREAPLPSSTRDDWDTFGQPPLEGDIAASVASSAELDAEVRRQLEEALRAELTETPRRRVSGRTWVGLAVAMLLVLVLAGQWLYMQRAWWLDHPQWRPWADRACAVLGCELPLRRDIAQIDLLEREVRDHPRMAEAVLIDARFINRADFVQPYPVFEVELSDLSGRQLALHRFAPEEYLEDPGLIPAGLLPGQPVALRLEVPDPGRQAVSFRMEFR